MWCTFHLLEPQLRGTVEQTMDYTSYLESMSKLCACVLIVHMHAYVHVSGHMQIHQQATLCENIREGPDFCDTSPLLVASKVIGF